MASSRFITAFLIVQFLLVAAVPCKCLTAHFAQGSVPTAVASLKPSQAACPHNCCTRPKAITTEKTETLSSQVCLSAPRRSTCPGKLLPDLAPPPAQNERLALLGSQHLPVAVAADVQSAVREGLLFGHVPRRQCAAPNISDQSLLRQHCALIV